jgi:pimeloyl-ACP methyl ester carboxylesterase/DNA-binding winged helix-turn-helix (wHTH) protein
MIYRFDHFHVDDKSRELRRGKAMIEIEPQVFDLLVYLIRNRDKVVSKEELFEAIWAGRIVSESALTSRINAARHAVGDTGAQQSMIRTSARKGYRFVGLVSEGENDNSAAAPPQRDAAIALRQDIRFCTAADGPAIAYASVGSGPPLVKAGNWLNHLEYDWNSPIWSHLLHWLARDYRLIRYDARGNGLSDWDVGSVTLDHFVTDLEAVIEASGLKRFSLFGVSQGCAVSIAYAVRHPEQVSKLVLYGGFALGRRMRGHHIDAEQAEAMLTLMRTGWGQENPAFRQFFTSLFVPGATPEQMDWFNNLQRVTTSAENAVKMRLVSDYMNIVDLLPLVKMPTLVMHCRDDAVQPFDEGRRIATGIPGARFVALDGRNHLILEKDAAWPRFQAEVAAFLAE